MKTVKTIVLVFVLGMFGYVYADQNPQSTTQKSQPAAAHCKMDAKDGGCCSTGAPCCKEGASCCKEGEECCGSGKCCEEGSSCCAGATAENKHKGHDSKVAAACCKAKDDSKAGCSASGCCADKATKK
jgi:hypothetical protein